MNDENAINNSDERTTPKVLEGDLVQAPTRFDDEDEDGRPVTAAEKGAVGHVIGAPEPGHLLVNVYWERTGRVFAVGPEELHVLAEAGFASTEATTPRRPRREFLRRGLS